VLNDERLGKYVLNWEEFHFSEGVLQALRILGQKFGRMIIITNQRGLVKR
jgi:histidinol phosphatase-like enzyme